VCLALVESGAFEEIRMTYPVGDRGSIGADSLARLLARLHPNTEQAAHEYERLRRSLVKFFDWRGVSPPDECADDVLDRLAHRLEHVDVQDVRKYVHGIARLVALERHRAPAFSSIDEIPQIAQAAPAQLDDRNRLHDCLDRCLADLPDESRSLIVRYYDGERTAKISNRRRLASVLGVTESALRNRVQRLRDRLEQCVGACSSQPVGQMP
jgi:DNA-directed RNA polymerase specialized sigma24 family protein